MTADFRKKKLFFLFNGREFNLVPTLNTPWLPVINKRASRFQIKANSLTQWDCDVEVWPGVLLSSSIIKWSGSCSLLNVAVMDLCGLWSDFLWRFPSGLMRPARLTLFLHELLTLSSSLFLPVAVWLFFLPVCEFVICSSGRKNSAVARCALILLTIRR